MVKLDSIMKDFNKKPADKKPEPEKTIETITGGSNLPEKKDTLEKKDIFPIKSQTQIGSVVPKAQVVIKAPPANPVTPQVSVPAGGAKHGLGPAHALLLDHAGRALHRHNRRGLYGGEFVSWRGDGRSPLQRAAM